jgi:hypothetical protein
LHVLPGGLPNPAQTKSDIDDFKGNCQAVLPEGDKVPNSRDPIVRLVAPAGEDNAQVDELFFHHAL